MEGSRKMTAGILIFIGLIVWCLAPAFAQTMTFKFHPDGTTTAEHDSPEGYSIERYDNQMRVLEKSHYFPGGVRMRMFDKYRYENNMLVEKIAYIYTQGYERNTYKFNTYGYKTESRHYTSQTEGNWVEDHYMIEEFDDRNNRVYFRVKGTAYGNTNSMSRTTYDYANRTSTVVEYKFDANDREISSNTYKRGVADWEFNRAGKYQFDINTHGANMRPERVINWISSDREGNRLEKVFINSNATTRVIDQKNRVIRMEFGRPTYDDNNELYYKYDEVIDFRYDQQGRLIETESKHYSDAKEKRSYTYGRTVEEKHYRQNANGGWRLIATKNIGNIDLLTPHQPNRANKPIASSVQQGDPVRPQSYPSDNQNSMADKPLSNGKLLSDLNGLKIESNQSESLSAFSLDAEKLSHIADVLSHASGTKVSEEQVLALAMQLLIENYNADLREMNSAYLRDKVSVFD